MMGIVRLSFTIAFILLASCRTLDQMPISGIKDDQAITYGPTPMVRSGQYDLASKSLVFELSHGGGCKTHRFGLKIGSCSAQKPIRCDAMVVDFTSDDLCRMVQVEKAILPVKDLGLNSVQYSEAILDVVGANNSKVSIALPILPLE